MHLPNPFLRQGVRFSVSKLLKHRVCDCEIPIGRLLPLLHVLKNLVLDQVHLQLLLVHGHLLEAPVRNVRVLCEREIHSQVLHGEQARHHRLWNLRAYRPHLRVPTAALRTALPKRSWHDPVRLLLHSGLRHCHHHHYRRLRRRHCYDLLRPSNFAHFCCLGSFRHLNPHSCCWRAFQHESETDLGYASPSLHKDSRKSNYFCFQVQYCSQEIQELKRDCREEVDQRDL